jgi:hypothetical protein
VLEEFGHEVLVANPRKTRLIYTNKRKTDELDAENLARLARLDPKLLYPLKHRSERSQAHLAIIRSREALVGCRTQLVNPGAISRIRQGRDSCAAFGSLMLILDPYGSCEVPGGRAAAEVWRPLKEGRVRAGPGQGAGGGGPSWRGASPSSRLWGWLALGKKKA